MKGRKQAREAGMTLIELLVVVAILLVITAVAVPSLITARSSSQEKAAASMAKNLAGGADLYSQNWNVVPLKATNLAGAETASTVPGTCAAGAILPTVEANVLDVGMIQSGYTFKYKATGTSTGNSGCAGATLYDFTAIPQTPTTRSFCADASGIYYLANGAGTPATGAGCAADFASGIPLGQ